MKTILRMAVVAVLTVLALTACNGDKPKKGLLKQGAMVYVNVKQEGLKAMEAMASKDEARLTPRQIVEQALNFMFIDPETKKTDMNIGILDVQRDLENERIKMWGEQVINKDGTLNDYFISLRDVRILGLADAIIGYIPNKVMEKADKEIRQAYEAGEYEKVYKLFQEAYTAMPITTKEWNALKEKGEQ